MCSSTRGPATAPSFVTWPTRNTLGPSFFARCMSMSPHSRTCVTQPPSELADAGPGARHVARLDRGQRARLPRAGGGTRSPARARAAAPRRRYYRRLDRRVPRAARRAAPEPARRLVAALRAVEASLGLFGLERHQKMLSLRYFFGCALTSSISDLSDTIEVLSWSYSLSSLTSLPSVPWPSWTRAARDCITARSESSRPDR